MRFNVSCTFSFEKTSFEAAVELSEVPQALVLSNGTDLYFVSRAPLTSAQDSPYRFTWALRKASVVQHGWCPFGQPLVDSKQTLALMKVYKSWQDWGYSQIIHLLLLTHHQGRACTTRDTACIKAEKKATVLLYGKTIIRHSLQKKKIGQEVRPLTVPAPPHPPIQKEQFQHCIVLFLNLFWDLLTCGSF